jgi:hypothetical protein
MTNRKTSLILLGRQKLSVWAGMEGCGSVNTKTPGLAINKTPMDKIDKVC